MRVFIGLLLLISSMTYAADRPADKAKLYNRYLNEFDAMVEGGVTTPMWLPDGNTFWVAEGSPADREVFRIDPVSGSKSAFFDVSRLRRVLEQDLGYPPPYSGVPFASFAALPGNNVQFQLEGHSYTLNLDSYDLVRLPAADPFEAFNPNSEAARFTPKTFKRQLAMTDVRDAPDVLSPDRKYFATVVDGNLALRWTADGRYTMVTDDAVPAHGWDLESGRIGIGPVASLHPWSPDSLKLFAMKLNKEKVFPLPQVHYLKGVEEVNYVRFQKAGAPLDVAQLYIVDVLKREPVKLDLGDTTDQYFHLLTWLPDGSEVWFTRYSRDFKRVDILAANLDGAVRTVLSESTDTFVKLQHDVIYAAQSGFTLLPDGSGFIWESTRDGWNHLYHYGLDGKLKRRLTKGEFPVLDVVKIDQADGYVYFTANGESRLYDTHLYRAPLSGGRHQRLTEGAGKHNVHFAPSLGYFVDNYSSVVNPPRSVLRAADGTLVMDLGEADISALEEFGWTEPEEFVVKAADGETDLYGVMYKPADFDPNKRYPLVEYIYGGPQIAMTPREFSGNPRANYTRALAQLGFLVVTLDARGTPDRSKAFQDVVYGAWGVNEIPDHAAALRQLGERYPWVDLDRVGMFGGSWGGYFTFRAMIDAPELYKVGVADVPGFDPYAGILYEPYLGMPEDNKAAYEHASMFDKAHKLKGQLLLTGGTSDYATLTDVFKMSRQLIDHGIHHDMFVYAAEGHGYFGKAGAMHMEKRSRYFETHLKPHSE